MKAQCCGKVSNPPKKVVGKLNGEEQFKSRREKLRTENDLIVEMELHKETHYFLLFSSSIFNYVFFLNLIVTIMKNEDFNLNSLYKIKINNVTEL